MCGKHKGQGPGPPSLPVFPPRPTFQRLPRGQASKGGESPSRGATRPRSLTALRDGGPAPRGPGVCDPSARAVATVPPDRRPTSGPAPGQAPARPPSSHGRRPRGGSRPRPHRTHAGSGRTEKPVEGGSGARPAPGGREGGRRARAVGVKGREAQGPEAGLRAQGDRQQGGGIAGPRGPLKARGSRVTEDTGRPTLGTALPR